MKAVILAAGQAKRLGGIEKCMLEVGGKPILEHVLRRACEIADEIVLVNNEKMDKPRGNFGGKDVIYRYQEKPDGIIGAIECAAGALAHHDFFLMLGDEVMVGCKHKEMVQRWNKIKSDTWGMCGVKIEHDKEKIKKTYVVLSLNKSPKDVYVAIEKPDVVIGPLMGTGHCIFKNKVLEYLRDIPVSERGERELVDLIQVLADDERRVEIFEVCDQYVNVNTQEDYEEAKTFFV